MVGFTLIESETVNEHETIDERVTNPHEVAMELATVSEMLQCLENAGIEAEVIDEEDASLVRATWETFVRTFAYMYLVG